MFFWFSWFWWFLLLITAIIIFFIFFIFLFILSRFISIIDIYNWNWIVNNNWWLNDDWSWSSSWVCYKRSSWINYWINYWVVRIVNTIASFIITIKVVTAIITIIISSSISLSLSMVVISTMWSIPIMRVYDNNKLFTLRVSTLPSLISTVIGSSMLPLTSSMLWTRSLIMVVAAISMSVILVWSMCIPMVIFWKMWRESYYRYWWSLINQGKTSQSKDQKIKFSSSEVYVHANYKFIRLEYLYKLKTVN